MHELDTALAMDNEFITTANVQLVALDNEIMHELDTALAMDNEFITTANVQLVV